jgi:hypothetical protein
VVQIFGNNGSVIVHVSSADAVIAPNMALCLYFWGLPVCSSRCKVDFQAYLHVLAKKVCQQSLKNDREQHGERFLINFPEKINHTL